MIHFISDLHLAAQTPGVTRIFLDFLAGRARSAEHLYILGDLFEAWPGDDCINDPEDEFNYAIVEALRALTDSGVGLSVMHGNRDFLLGANFAALSGARLLPDPYVLSAPAGRFVLSHGDVLCTDDTDYQAFRAVVRNPAWRSAFLDKPLPKRKAIAASLRQQSEKAKRDKLAQAQAGKNDRRHAPQQMPQHILFDLNSVATDAFLRDHGYATFIHGHTHRPATHDHWVDGIHVQRWVMADWHDDGGECLCWDGQHLRREVLR